MVSPDGYIVPLKNKKCKPRLINGRDCLALNLAWTRTKGSCYCLQMLFGMTASCVSVYLRFGRRILIKVLQRQDEAAIRLPSRENVEEYVRSIQERHPILENVWCTMDGLKLLETTKFKTCFTTVGRTTITCLVFLFLHQTGQSPSAATMSQVAFMIQKSQNGVTFIKNLKKCITFMESNAPSIVHLRKGSDHSY